MARSKRVIQKYIDFSGGYQTFTSPLLLKVNESPFLYNVDISKPGILAKSLGYVPKVAQAERVASRSVSGDVATEVQASTQATNDEVTQTAVPAEVKREPEPDLISDIEVPDDTPARAVERAKAPNKRNLVIDGFNQRDTVLNRNDNFASKFLERDNLVPVVEKVMNKTPTEKQHQALKDFAKFNKYSVLA